MTSNRRGQAQSALRAVEGRHEAIQKIEKDMIELAQLFQDMEAAVVQQEPAVEIIDQKAEDTQMNISKGNEQLDQAVVKARSARRKKWICLGISSEYTPIPPIQCFFHNSIQNTYEHKSSSSWSLRPSSSWCSNSPPTSSNEHLHTEVTGLTAFSSHRPYYRCCHRYRIRHHTKQLKERDMISSPVRNRTPQACHAPTSFPLSVFSAGPRAIHQIPLAVFSSLAATETISCQRGKRDDH